MDDCQPGALRASARNVSIAAADSRLVSSIVERHGSRGRAFYSRSLIGASRSHQGLTPAQAGNEPKEARETSKRLEIFAVLPVRHLGLEAGDLRVLDPQQVVHEVRTQRLAEEGVEIGRAHV